MTTKVTRPNKNEKKTITFDNLRIAYHTYMKVLKRFENSLYTFDPSYYVGYIFIVSFLCEIGLKALLVYDNQKAIGHNLYELFIGLNEDMQNALAILNDCSLIEFKEKLKKNSDHFVEWRYFYEGKSKEFDVKFIDRFIKVMEIFLDDLNVNDNE